MNKVIEMVYGNQVRVRVCGLCVHNNQFLMVNHAGLSDKNFWSPPGGGIKPGETAADALSREFYEETGITIRVGEFKFVCEFIRDPLHAIELFFIADYISGEVITGHDPEMNNIKQIIQDVKWLTPQQIMDLPKHEVHGIFNICANPEELMQLSGYWRI